VGDICQVSFRAVARNPALAKAAQAELGCSQEFSRTAIEDSDEVPGHSHSIQSQTQESDIKRASRMGNIVSGKKTVLHSTAQHSTRRIA
jgi:hypothetical protein